MSKIEWTGKTWNPVTGCNKISPGCKHCYAATMANRLQAMGQAKYVDGFKVTLHLDELKRPETWKKPQTIFVCSMADLFHTDVPLDFIQQVFQAMQAVPQHTFQVLTKRAERLEDMTDYLNWGNNIWQGVSVERADYLYRVDSLRQIKAPVRFLSLEPLLGPLSELNLTGIDWVIVGGESGPGARPMNPDWAREIRDLCQLAGVPFFFKQHGGVNKKQAGRELDGRTWDEMPFPRSKTLLQK